MKLFIGIDPGASGGMAILDPAGSHFWPAISFGKYYSPYDIANIYCALMGYDCHFMIEGLHALPGFMRGSVSSFKIGKSCGLLEGFITALRAQIDHEHPGRWQFNAVSPRMWMKFMDCMTGGDKKVTLLKAKNLWPDQGATHATADAMLIAEYNRRVNNV